KEQQYYLLGVIRLDYKIIDLYDESLYLVDLNVSLCWESYKPCSFVAAIFKNSILPKKTCMGQLDYDKPGFSLSNYSLDNQLDLNNLTERDLVYLYDYMGISSYVSNASCNRQKNESMYASNGWNNECPTTVTPELSSLPDYVTCHMMSSCTSISCCMDLTRLKSQSVQFYLMMDSCEWVIEYGIDKFSVRPTIMYDFKFDEWHDYWMKGIYRLRFMVTHLQGADTFRVTLRFMVCLEDGLPCEQEVTVLNNTLLPKSSCNWKIGIPVEDFTFSSWKTQNKYTTMEEHSIARLEEELGMHGYLYNSTQVCERTSGIFASPSAGWTNDCPIALPNNVPVVRGAITCNLGASCSDVVCCLYAEPLMKHVTISLSLDYCQDRIRVGIDKFTREIQPSSYNNWGTEEMLDMSEIYQLKYTLEDLPNANMYLVSFSIRSCWEGPSNCEEYIVLSNTRLPKSKSQPYCNWKSEEPIPAFSVKSWLATNGYPDSTPLKGNALQDLMEVLQLSRFKENRDCNVTGAPFVPVNSNDWNSECPVNESLRTLNSSVVCHLPSLCTGLECCVSSSVLGLYFHTFLQIDTCTSEIIVGIDRWTFREVSMEINKMLSATCRISGLPYNMKKKTYCVVGPRCTSMTCCTEDPEMETTFTWFIDVDSCNLELTLGIEEFRKKISLLEFEFGQKNQFHLKGIYRISYVIYDLILDSHYMMSVNLSVCYEPDNCTLTEIIVRNVMFPKPVCNFMAKDFFIPSFSMSSWLAEHAFRPNSTLPLYGQLELLEDLGLAQYMKDKQCQETDDIYRSHTDRWTKDCPLSVLTSPLPAGLLCHLPSTCTAVHCCITTHTPLQRSLSTVLDLDPCNQRISLGIENFVHEISLYDFQFGVEHHYDLRNVVQMKYKVYDLKADRKYQVSLNISLCLESSGPCVLDSMLFDNALLPKKPCSLNTGYIQKNFSLSQWMIQHGRLNQNLTDLDIALLKEDLGISEYLGESCFKKSTIYFPHKNYWKDKCGKVSGMSQFTESDDINCYLSDTCTTVSCCVEDSVLKRNIETRVSIDPCKFTMKLEIEKLQFNISLMNFTWGELMTVDLYGIYKISILMENFYNERKYLMSMNISQCYESSQNCHLDLVVFKNSLIPKGICSWSMDFNMKDFSLYKWRSDRKLGNIIPDEYLLQLMDETGLAGFIKQPMCNRSDGVYLNTVNGWTSDCGMNMSLPYLNTDYSCHMLATCSGIRCCLYSSQLRRNFEVYFDINNCTESLSIQIEKIFHNKTLNDLQWGEPELFSIFGVYNVRYTIEDLKEKRAYLVSMHVMERYEAKLPLKDSAKTFKILDRMLFPKGICSGNEGFVNPDFSLKGWLIKNSLVNVSELMQKDYMVSRLMDEMAISQYLETPHCRTTSKYAVGGWITSCMKNIIKPNISGAVCHLKEDCTSTECCVEVEYMTRNIKTYLNIDPCSSELQVSIEKFSRNISLTQYKWGQFDKLQLGGIIRLEFSLDDFKDANFYVVNMNLSICFEANQPCQTSFMVYKDTVLPKRRCPQDINMGFSLSEWKQKEKVSNSTQIPAWAKYLLLEHLDIAQYMEPSPCKRGAGRFSKPISTGSVNMCPLEVDLVNRSLDARSATLVSCYLPSLCTGFHCCVDVPDFNMSFNAYLSVDPCNYMFTVGIEKFTVSKSLDQFKFGEDEVFSLAGILKIIYNLRDLHNEKAYLATVKLSVCTESSSCEANHTIFNNVLLPKQPCDWNEGFVNSNFSGSAWMINNGYLPPLNKHQSAELMREMRTAQYLLSESCRDQEIYNFSALEDGWNNFCPNVQVNNLTSAPIGCYLDFSCSSINCCIIVEKMGRSFSVHLKLDPCSKRMMVYLERLKIEVDLQEIEYGKVEHYSLFGMIKMNLVLYDLPFDHAYQMDLNVSVCFESRGNCDVEVSVLKNAILRKSECDWTKSLEGFSLKKWFKSIGVNYSSNSSVSSTLQDLLFEDRGIANVMKKVSCDLSGPLYNTTVSVNGWINDCLKDPFLPILPNGTTCVFQPSCSALSCCMEVTKLNERTIEVSVEFDECSNFLKLTIEGLSQTKYLHNFVYGMTEKFSLKGIFEVTYSITRDMQNRRYLFDLDVAACFEDGECEQNYTILNQTNIQMKICKYQDGFFNSNFSLMHWMGNRSIDQVQNIKRSQASELLLNLGLDHFLTTSEKCSLSDSVYGGVDTNGWNNECKLFPNDTLTDISDTDTVRCHVPSSCDRVMCCVYIQPVQRHAQMELIIDTCTYDMEGVIDNLKVPYRILDRDWGRWEEIGIHGVVHWGYHVTPVSSKKKFLVDGTIRLCFEKEFCKTNLTVFSNLPFHFQTCNASDGELPFKGISYDFWKATECPNSEFNASACSSTQINRIPTDGQKYCHYLSNCTGIECCFDSAFYQGNKTIYFKLDIGCENLEFQIESKRVVKSLPTAGSIESVETFGDLPDFQLNYTITENSSNYLIKAILIIQGIINDPSGKINYTILDMNSSISPPTGCSHNITMRGRKKRSLEVIKLDPANFKEGLRTLLETNASNEEIENYIRSVQNHDRQTKQDNLAATVLEENDVKTGLKSAIIALRSSNPFTIHNAGEVTNTVTVKGGEAIRNMLGKAVSDIVGRVKQAFIVGNGLSNEGVRLLGQKLACMTIGDLESLLDLKNIDPVKVAELLKELGDLAKALYSEILNKILTNGTSIFKSLDLRIEGDFSFPRHTNTLFHYQTSIPLGGLLTLSFGFGANYYYGVKFVVGAKLLEMKGYVTIVPNGGVSAYGFVSVGFILYGELRLTGQIMEVGFPTTAEITFNKFPLDVNLQMFLQLRPLRLTLEGLVTLKIHLIFHTFKKTLFKHRIWHYETPVIQKKIIDTHKKEKDKTPPQIKSFGGVTRPGECKVLQAAGRDHTDPEFKLDLDAEDDRSNVILTLDVGTVPGGSDVVYRKELGGFSTSLTEILNPSGVPLYFTVHVANEAGVSVPATCQLETFDMTIPGGRMSEAFRSTSNPRVMKGLVTVYEDSPITQVLVAVGYGRDIWGEQIVRWNQTSIAANTVNYDVGYDPLNLKVMTLFSDGRSGKLVGRHILFKEYDSLSTPGECATHCNKMHDTKCLSFNYDFGSGHCELLEAIEGYNFKISKDGHYMHYEKLGVGSNRKFEYNDLDLQHNTMYYFNIHVKNSLGFENILSSESILTDFTPPDPTEAQINMTSDVLEVSPCLDLIPNDRQDWERHCVGVDPSRRNHRIVIDGEGSDTVYNGHEFKTDLKYTRANRYISANWDGIYDNETGLLGYSVTAGEKICEEKIKAHHDPHAHLFDESQWTNSVMMTPLEAPYTILPDGAYFITVRAINKVKYGGPLATTFCHSTPYIVDNSPPLIYEIYNIYYDEEQFNLSITHNSSDPDSGLKRNDLCLGRTRRDCDEMMWTTIDFNPNITMLKKLTEGVPVWIKIKAVNKVDLSTIAVSDSPIIVDQSPPIAGKVNDGEVYKKDLQYTMYPNKICSNWEGFYDPQSGIAIYMVSVGSSPNTTDVANLTHFSSKVHFACVELDQDKYLEHNKKYFSKVYAFNGAHEQLNVSMVSDGVLVDLTEPVAGEVVDGSAEDFTDLQFTTSQAKIELQWRNYLDPESNISHYDVKVYRAKNMTYDYEPIYDWAPFPSTANGVKWLKFHHSHGDRIQTSLRTTNKALNSIINNTNSFVVDITPPHLHYLWDGLQSKDQEFQSATDQLSVSFKYSDKESGIDHIKIQIYEVSHGTKKQKYPVKKNEWMSLSRTALSSYTWNGLSLINGARYSMRVAAINYAGYLASFETNGVIIDTSSPLISWLKIGTVGNSREHRVDGYVWVSDKKGIQASWLCKDHESGVIEYTVAIGTSPGGDDVLAWKSVGTESSQYITGFTLEVTNQTTKSPTYYLSLKAKNGAGLVSPLATVSTPIMVMEEDKAGLVVDGADNIDKIVGEDAVVDFTSDTDYQLDTTTVTVQFTGFESTMHGVMQFEMAVGTEPNGEDILAFTEANVIHLEELDPVGKGLTSSGYAQINIPLKPERTYYTTVRGITNNGNVLQTSSDGFTVDQTSPTIDIDRLSGKSAQEMDISDDSLVYESTDDALSAMWHYNDSESEVVRAWYAVGTYPFSDDLSERKEVEISTTLSSYLGNNEMEPDIFGKPNIISVWAENSVGLVTQKATGTVVIDKTPPTTGNVTCPGYLQKYVPVVCTWTGIIDTESPIKEFHVMMGTSKGDDSIFSGGVVPGNVQTFTLQGVGKKMLHGVEYFVTVTAVNYVGMTTSVFSKAIVVDLTPPQSGMVVDLNSVYRIDASSTENTVAMNAKICHSEKECRALDAVCTESLTSLSVTWIPFTDPESSIVEYQIAVGTSPGGGQIKAFYSIPADSKHHTVTELNLDGYRQVFVSVKGINGAGLSSVATSNGVYMSYLSQGRPPLSHIGVIEMVNGEHIDVDYQTDPTTIQATWDVSGDPCPVVQYEWAVRRLDGLEISSYLNMGLKTYGLIDGLNLKNKETYINFVRVRNAIGYQYELRSTGVTIESTPLLPGKVYDGDIDGFDLNYLPLKTRVSANWNGFGLPSNAIVQVDVESGKPGLQIDKVKINQQDKSQQVAYYLVALGTDRRFNKTRDNVVPYLNVGTNTSVTFYDLDLSLGDAVYYFSVYAVSKSFSKTLVTSNGFYVGYDGGVTAGTITLPTRYISSQDTLEVQYEGFSSRLGILMYYIAISNTTDANFTNCKEFISDHGIPDSKRQNLFSEMDVRNVGKNTYEKFDVQLQHGKTYFVWVIGTDKSGECAMSNTKFTVDITKPLVGIVKTGPWYNMPVAYLTKNNTVAVQWEKFEDRESGICQYEVSLWNNTSCNVTSTEQIVVDWIHLSKKYTSYQFIDLGLQINISYFVKLRVTNCAGISSTANTPPVLLDYTKPIAGVVKDGKDYQTDVLWFSDTTEVYGTFLHFANPTLQENPCPNQIIRIKDPDWKILHHLGMLDDEGEFWKIKYDEKYVIPAAVEDKIQIKLVLTKDATDHPIFGSGAIYRRAELYNGGTYKFRLRAADKDGDAVTEILFWDGPERGFATFKYTEEKEFIGCGCCYDNPIPKMCEGCNCTDYILNKGFLLNETFTTTTTTTQAPDNRTYPPYDVVDEQGSSVIDKPETIRSLAYDSCGIQIYSADNRSDASAFIVSWCRYVNNTRQMSKLKTEIQINPSDDFYNYKIDFVVKNEDSVSTKWCMMVYVEEEFINEICDVPQLSTNALLFFHVFKRHNEIPPHEDRFSVWSTKASLSGLEMPPAVGTLCRSGPQFISYTNPIMLYEAGVGTSPLLTNAVEFTPIDHPCIPCYGDCSHYGCDADCNATVTVQKFFTLTNISLPSKRTIYNETGHPSEEPISYYLTVRGTSGSGDTAIASSDGFYVDDTPPKYDPELMENALYIDVAQGESTPAHYQKSNDTIKCIWKCDDDESGVVEYTWAIGTTPGSTDIQNFTSTGQNVVGINDQLGGILEHDQTYYATITCTNGAGHTTVFTDTRGVIVTLIPPKVESVNTTIPGTIPFTEEVSPKASWQQHDPTTVGITFTKSDDPSVNRYDLCVGSEENTDDIVPCTWVGYNMSGSAIIRNGSLWINGKKLARISELKSVQDYSNLTYLENNHFLMPVGKQMFVTMRLCNEAMLCTNKSLGVVVITNSESVIATSTNGTAIKERLSLSVRKRSTADLDISTPSGLVSRQTIIVTKLTQRDLETTYSSDASTNFVPYIQDPATSNDMVQRLLYKRMHSQKFAFSFVSLGNTPMPGPVTISYPNAMSGIQNGTRIMLLHWNPIMQYWEISSKTCTHLTEEEQEMHDPNTQTITVKVCNTYSRETEKLRKRRSIQQKGEEYFRKETMFILADVEMTMHNKPPVLNCQNTISLLEDSGIVNYQLVAFDPEGDTVLFELPHQSLQFGVATLTPEGYFSYSPCQDCSGVEYINIVMYEIDEDIDPQNSSDILEIHIEEVNDPPIVFLLYNGQSILHDDPTEPITVLLEAKNDFNTEKWNDTWQAVLGAYDVEEHDHIQLHSPATFLANFSVFGQTNRNPKIPENKKDCTKHVPNSILQPCAVNFTDKLPHSAEKMSWLSYTVEFSQPMNQFGNLTTSFFFVDSSNGTSLPVTIRFGIMESPCHNMGTCQPTGIYPCNDTHRTQSFDAYYRCECLGGYQGKYCTEDINECLSDPCVAPLICYNEINHYRCACPQDQPNCELLPWMIALIVILVVAALAVIIGLGIFRYKAIKRKEEYGKILLGSKASLESTVSFKNHMTDDVTDPATNAESSQQEFLSDSEDEQSENIDVEDKVPPIDTTQSFEVFARHTSTTFKPLIPVGAKSLISTRKVNLTSESMPEKLGKEETKDLQEKYDDNLPKIVSAKKPKPSSGPTVLKKRSKVHPSLELQSAVEETVLSGNQEEQQRGGKIYLPKLNFYNKVNPEDDTGESKV
ncbi:uncharacterized protein LOC134257978, partial [Saccostrea cucullata]|uniref:uncharacterized protein LOC134257978 n=1 Tax=Saccostrea cuccullata TaxID=36930 RepID=UPI002ED063C1